MKDYLLRTIQWLLPKMVPSLYANKLKAPLSFSQPETMERLPGNVCCILISFTFSARSNQW